MLLTGTSTVVGPSAALERVLPVPPATAEGLVPAECTHRPPARSGRPRPAGVMKYVVPETVFGAGVLDEIGHAALRPTRFRPLAQALGVPDAERLPAGEVGEALAVEISVLATAIGAPRTLGEIGVVEADLAALARQTLCDACLTTNPRDVTEADVSAILRAAL